MSFDGLEHIACDADCRFFYGHGRLVAEICCSSMVYQAEKKLTKIEFPDTRFVLCPAKQIMSSLVADCMRRR